MDTDETQMEFSSGEQDGRRESKVVLGRHPSPVFLLSL
jgi:hypothetical protein